MEVAVPRTTTLHLNTSSGPFADPAIRAAGAEAIDKAELVDNVFEGYGDAADGFFDPALPWAQPLREEDAYTSELAQRAEPAQKK